MLVTHYKNNIILIIKNSISNHRLSEIVTFPDSQVDNSVSDNNLNRFFSAKTTVDNLLFSLWRKLLLKARLVITTGIDDWLAKSLTRLT